MLSGQINEKALVLHERGSGCQDTYVFNLWLACEAKRSISGAKEIFVRISSNAWGDRKYSLEREILLDRKSASQFSMPGM